MFCASLLLRPAVAFRRISGLCAHCGKKIERLMRPMSRSAGGYLRSLTYKAKDCKFSVWPMVMALLRAKLDAPKAAGSGVETASAELGRWCALRTDWKSAMHCGAASSACWLACLMRALRT